MKPIIYIILLLSCFEAIAQKPKEEFNAKNWQPPYKLVAPDGWGIERFPIPIEFAPKIPYRGVEDLRFNPGWSDPKADGYWTYTFLWYLDGKQELTKKTIQQNLKEYYTGLIGRNIEPRKIPKDKLIPTDTSFKKEKPDDGDLQKFTGTIKMLDYMEQKPIVLNCIIHVKSCPQTDHTFVVYEISPKPFSHAVWQELDQIRKDFLCSTN